MCLDLSASCLPCIAATRSTSTIRALLAHDGAQRRTGPECVPSAAFSVRRLTFNSRSRSYAPRKAFGTHEDYFLASLHTMTNRKIGSTDPCANLSALYRSGVLVFSQTPERATRLSACTCEHPDYYTNIAATPSSRRRHPSYLPSSATQGSAARNLGDKLCICLTVCRTSLDFWNLLPTAWGSLLLLDFLSTGRISKSAHHCCEWGYELSTSRSAARRADKCMHTC